MRPACPSNWSSMPGAPIEIVVQHLVEIGLRRWHGNALRTEQLLGGFVVEYLLGGEVVEKDRRGPDRAADFFWSDHAERHEHGAEQGARDDRGARDRDAPGAKRGGDEALQLGERDRMARPRAQMKYPAAGL